VTAAVGGGEHLGCPAADRHQTDNRRPVQADGGSEKKRFQGRGYTMYDDETPMNASIAEPEPVGLMRRFCEISEAIEQEERATERSREKRLSWGKEREDLRRQIDGIINPEQVAEAGPFDGEPR
jgi:hypothetical protein